MRYRKSIEVPVTIDEAFAYVADFGNAAEWDPGLLESRRLDDGPLQVGSAFHILADVNGKPQAFRYAIEELSAPSRVVIFGRGPRATSRDEVTFEPGDAGRTRITYDVDLRLRGPLRIAELFMGGFLRALGDKALAGLQQQLDARAAG